MIAKHEEFIFFQECITSLNSAWAIIDALNSGEAHKTLAAAAYRMALIEYAKPYKKSAGVLIKRHSLSLPRLSDEDKELHEYILWLRDTTLAHSDLTVKDAKLYVGNIGGAPLPMIISNTELSLPPLEAVRGLVERSLDQLYKEIPAWGVKINEQP